MSFKSIFSKARIPADGTDERADGSQLPAERKNTGASTPERETAPFGAAFEMHAESLVSDGTPRHPPQETRIRGELTVVPNAKAVESGKNDAAIAQSEPSEECREQPPEALPENMPGETAVGGPEYSTAQESGDLPEDAGEDRGIGLRKGALPLNGGELNDDDAKVVDADIAAQSNSLACDSSIVPTDMLSPPFAATQHLQNFNAQEDHDSGILTGNRLPPQPTDRELLQLRGMLFDHELVFLNRLEQNYANPTEHAKEVSSVISEALLMRSGKDEKLTKALEPSVNAIFKSSVRRNPYEFANSILPFMGSVIRRSIADSFRSMLESFNKSVELSFSLKGLRWRVEAIRSGKPFSEIVLLHTLVYKVEQIFFIHSETGLVLAHSVAEDVATQDADMVSAMLTAIQDFVRDCFANGQEGSLESLQFGDSTIMVERTPQAYLACVVKGTPPAGFRDKLRETLDLLLIEFSEEIDTFQGDTDPFKLACMRLEDCLISKFAGEDKELSNGIKALPVILVLLLGCLFWYAQFRSYTAEKTYQVAHTKMLHGLDVIRAEPGIILIDSKETENPDVWAIFCLRDELSRPFEHIFADAGLTQHNFIVRSVPYVSYEPAIVTRRVAGEIHPPKSVAMDFTADGTLTLKGTAPMDWILQARQIALSLPGVKRVNLDVRDPRIGRLEELVQSIESTVVEFPLGKDMPAPQDQAKLAQAVTNMVELEKLAKDMGIAVSLTIYGHADAVGSDKRNFEISQERAKTLAAMLYARGSSMPISTYGMGSEYADKTKANTTDGDPASRKIELRVHLSQLPDADPALMGK